MDFHHDFLDSKGIEHKRWMRFINKTEEAESRVEAGTCLEANHDYIPIPF
jgi:hypothetical protein